MIYGYGRHSTDKQGLTEVAQKKQVEAYAATLDDEYAGWLYDSAVSGSVPLFEREEGRKLWVLAQPGDHIVWAKLDRAFRSVADGAATMAMLAQKGVFVHSLDLRLDTSTPIGRCVCTVMMAFAELERDYASTRTRDALRAKRDQGLPSNSATPIGWRKVGKKGSSYFTICTAEREQVAEIMEMRKDGMSYDDISIQMRRRKFVRPNGYRWNHNSVRAAVMAAQCGFPKQPVAEPTQLPVALPHGSENSQRVKRSPRSESLA
jgi:DNA invertase Pin-like site-specific DNA recombinase